MYCKYINLGDQRFKEINITETNTKFVSLPHSLQQYVGQMRKTVTTKNKKTQMFLPSEQITVPIRVANVLYRNTVYLIRQNDVVKTTH